MGLFDWMSLGSTEPFNTTGGATLVIGPDSAGLRPAKARRNAGMIPAGAVVTAVTAWYGNTFENIEYRMLDRVSFQGGDPLPESEAFQDALETWPLSRPRDPNKGKEAKLISEGGTRRTPLTKPLPIPQPKPTNPVPFLQATAAIVDLERSTDKRGSFTVDAGGRFALLVGSFQEVFVKNQGYVSAFVPDRSVPQSAIKEVLRLVFHVDVVEGRFQPLPAPNVFSRKTVESTPSYKARYLKVLEKRNAAAIKAEGKKPREPKEGETPRREYTTEEQAYLDTLTFGLTPFFAKEKDVKRERFRQPLPLGPGKWAAVGGSEVITHEMEKGKFPPSSTLYSLARKIAASTTDPRIAAFRTASVSQGREQIDPRVLELLEEHGIEPVRWGGGTDADQRAYYRALRDQLQELQRTMRISYQHEVPKEEGYSLLKSSAESPTFYEDFVAKLNPGWDPETPTWLDPEGRRPRRPRRERKPRGSYQNPLRDDQLAPLLTWAEKGGPEVPPDSFRELRTFDPGDVEKKDPMPLDWPLTNVREVLPRTGKISDFSLTGRRAGMSQRDLISRLQDEPIPHEVETSALTSPEFYRDAKVVPALVRRAELSLTQARDVLKEQKASHRGGKTIQSSTALVQTIRVPRLSGYRLPQALLDAGGPKKSVIWLSPEGQPFRVISLRRNTHIDADLIPIKGMTPVELVARALQSALFWLAEDPRRQDLRGGSTLYVGRVGRSSLAVAWEPGQPLTLAQVQDNLGRDIAGTSAAKTIKMPGYDAARDVENYIDAASKVRMRRLSPTATAPTAPPSAPTEDPADELETEASTAMTLFSPPKKDSKPIEETEEGAWFRSITGE